MRWCVLWLLLGSASIVGATVNTYQEGVSGPANSANVDTYLESAGAPARGDTGVLNTGCFDYNVSVYRTILEFDISDIGAGSVISDCVLDLYVGSIIIDGGALGNGTICRVLRSDWSEASADWTIYKTSTNWTTAGCSSDGNDVKSSGTGDDAPVAYTAPASTGHNTFGSLGPMCTDALANRTGKVRLRFKQTDETTGCSDTTFRGRLWQSDASDGATASQRPQLTVTFTAGGLGARMRKLLGVGRRGPYWPEDYEPPYPLGIFLP